MVDSCAWELEKNPIQGSVDFQHLKNIHRHFFQVVYDFAREDRVSNIGKNGHRFCDYNMIDRQDSNIVPLLKTENYLTKMAHHESRIRVPISFR